VLERTLIHTDGRTTSHAALCPRQVAKKFATSWQGDGRRTVFDGRGDLSVTSARCSTSVIGALRATPNDLGVSLTPQRDVTAVSQDT